jgi:hypothetical protein
MPPEPVDTLFPCIIARLAAIPASDPAARASNARRLNAPAIAAPPVSSRRTCIAP